jgi:hypothetical protein
MSKREKNNEKFIEEFFMSQKEWEIKRDKKIKYFYDKYKEELEDYVFINNIDKYNKIVKSGGYIRYFNYDEELRWGGILLKKIMGEFDDLHIMILMNSTGERTTVSYEKNYIFYKKHTTAADKTRKLFISYLDKYN